MPAVAPFLATAAMMVVGAAKISVWSKVFVCLVITALSNEASEMLMDKPDFEPLRGLGLQHNLRDTGMSLPLLYGEVKVGGADVFMVATGVDNQYMYIVQALGEGECEGIKNDGNGNPLIFINDMQLCDFEEKYGDLVEYTFYSGTSDQTYNADMNTVLSNFAIWHPDETPIEYTDNLQNTCYILWRFIRHPSIGKSMEAFSSVPDRTVVLQGRKCWLPDGTKAYTQNAAAILYDFLKSSHFGYGLGESETDQLSTDEIDYYSYLAAYNYCEQSAKAWEFNGAVYHDEMARDVINRIKKHFRGSLRWRDGMLYMHYKDLNEETPAMNLTDDHLARDGKGKAMISISQPGKSTSFDCLRVEFINTENNLYAEDYILIGDAEGVIRDIELTGYNNRETAGAMGTYIYERNSSPYDRIITGTFRDDCQQLNRDDLVTLTCSALGYSAQYMRVVSITRHASGLVSLSLQLEHADLYNDTFDVETEGYFTYDLPTPDEFDPSAEADRIIYLTDEDFDSNNEYTLTIDELGKTIIVDSNNDLTINLPSIDGSHVGEKIKFIHYGTGKLTIQAADSDTIDNSSAGGTVWHEEWA